MTVMPMMNATNAHAETPFWVPRGRFYARDATVLRAISDNSLIIGTLRWTWRHYRAISRVLDQIPKIERSDEHGEQPGQHEASKQHRPVPGIETEKPTISREAQCRKPQHRGQPL
jgi:hypothetical protein